MSKGRQHETASADRGDLVYRSDGFIEEDSTTSIVPRVCRARALFALRARTGDPGGRWAASLAGPAAGKPDQAERRPPQLVYQLK